MVVPVGVDLRVVQRGTVHKAVPSSPVFKFPSLRLVSINLHAASALYVKPYIVDCLLTFLLINDSIKDNQPILLVEFSDGLRIKAIDWKRPSEALVVSFQGWDLELFFLHSILININSLIEMLQFERTS